MHICESIFGFSFCFFKLCLCLLEYHVVLIIIVLEYQRELLPAIFTYFSGLHQLFGIICDSIQILKSLLIKVKEESEKWLKTHYLKTEDHSIWSHYFLGNRWPKSGKSDRLYFGGAPKSPYMMTAALKLKDAWSLKEKLWQTLISY